MKDIEIACSVGNDIRQLTIKFMANGIGQIIMDKYFHGQAVFAQNQWRVFLNKKSELNNCEDIHTLIQILNEGNKESSGKDYPA